jgi:hypothetical protein
VLAPRQSQHTHAVTTDTLDNSWYKHALAALSEGICPTCRKALDGHLCANHTSPRAWHLCWTSDLAEPGCPAIVETYLDVPIVRSCQFCGFTP